MAADSAHGRGIDVSGDVAMDTDHETFSLASAAEICCCDKHFGRLVLSSQRLWGALPRTHWRHVDFFALHEKLDSDNITHESLAPSVRVFPLLFRHHTSFMFRFSDRWGSAAVALAVSDEIIFFGGTTGNGFLNDLWVYYPDRQDWEMIDEGLGGPSVRAFSCLVPWPETRKAILFGGVSYNTIMGGLLFKNDVFVLDMNSGAKSLWTELFPSASTIAPPGLAWACAIPYSRGSDGGLAVPFCRKEEND